MEPSLLPTSPPPVRIPHYNQVKVRGPQPTLSNAPVPEGKALQERMRTIEYLYHWYVQKNAENPFVRALSEEYCFLEQWKENPPQLFTPGCKKVKRD